MAYVTNLGYNSFLLLNAGYTFTNQFYLIYPFDATLVNGDSIYLIDNPTGVSEDPTAGARADRVRNYSYNVNNDGNIQQRGSISWSSGTYYGDTYRTYPYKTYEPVFYTTLIYSHIYVNNEDVTPVLYTWSSVPAISGKNGILSLTQILNINDGEPVENVANRGNLDFSKKTKINTLINSAYEPTYSEDETKATVSYDIPESDYQYTKLVYKKKKIPKSPTDGTAINIGADDTEVVVTNLEPSTVYYFVVFTNRTKSNAYKFRTGSYIAPEGILKLKVTVDKALLDNDIKDFVSYEKLT